MCQVWGRGEVLKGCWWGSLKGEDYLQDLDVGGRIILNLIFRK
jgi:hypothetical protein